MSKADGSVDKRVRKTRNALKDALITLMQEKDFRDISVTDIVETADVNRGTFYRHFQYKEELLEELIEEVLSDLVRSYREPYEKVEVFDVRKLSASAIKIFQHVANHSRFYTMIVQSNALPGFQNRICRELKNLHRYDLLPRDGSLQIDVELLSSYHAYALFGMIIEWVEGGLAHSPAYMAEQLLHILHDPLQQPMHVKLVRNGPAPLQ